MYWDISMWLAPVMASRSQKTVPTLRAPQIDMRITPRRYRFRLVSSRFLHSSYHTYSFMYICMHVCMYVCMYIHCTMPLGCPTPDTHIPNTPKVPAKGVWIYSLTMLPRHARRYALMHEASFFLCRFRYRPALCR